MLHITIPADAGLLAILAVGLGAGMVHALDADHVAAVSGLAARHADWKASVRVAASWAIGHGLTLLGLGVVLFLLGVAIPEWLSDAAERVVGVMIVIIGVAVIVQLVRSRAHVHSHTHDGLPEHAHLHTHDVDPASPDVDVPDHGHDPHLHDHRAVLVGAVHGLAGSAPLLALIPLGQLGSPWLALAYLVLFGIGVLVTMLALGGVLGGVFRLGSIGGRGLVIAIRALNGFLAIAFGMWLLAVG